ncbi:MAG: class I SAM-dependent methyltransferase [Acidimicrobiales bacterium]
MAATLDELRLSESWEHEESMMADAIVAQANNGTALEILEAGCGRAWTIDLSSIEYRLTGVDIDAHALEARIEQGDLDTAIHGDICSVDLDDAQFDVVYSSYVLEHVEEADLMMDNLAQWLKPGGIMVVRIPDGDTVFGFITKFTPHWFHVFYRRRILRQPNAGKPGYEPYPTHYHPIVSRSAFNQYCSENGLEVIDEWGFPFMAHGGGVFEKIVVAGAKAMAFLSRGRLASRHQNITFVVRRPA